MGLVEGAAPQDPFYPADDPGCAADEASSMVIQTIGAVRASWTRNPRQELKRGRGSVGLGVVTNQELPQVGADYGLCSFGSV